MLIRSHTYIAVPPGETICEQLEVCGMNRLEFAAHMGLSETDVARLLDGEAPLTPDIASKLEAVLGSPASFWSGLETIYQEKYAKAEAENASRANIL